MNQLQNKHNHHTILQYFALIPYIPKYSHPYIDIYKHLMHF